MKRPNALLLVALLFATTTLTHAQLVCWRIVSGPAKGVVLRGVGDRGVFDPYFGAVGHVAHPDRCKCVHYHGVLFNLPDPSEGACGWGCVIPVPWAPSSAAEAAADLDEMIDYIYEVIDPDLGDKLGDIFDMMEAAADKGCYSVVDALADAFSEELQAYFLRFGFTTFFHPMVQNLAEYANTRLAAMTAPSLYPSLNAQSVQLVRRIGTGSHGRLVDAGSRINLRVGEVLTLQMLAGAGFVNPLFLWQYRWKGAAEGEIPNLTAMAVLAQYATFVAYHNTTLKLTGLVRDESGQLSRDTIVVNWRDSAY